MPLSNNSSKKVSVHGLKALLFGASLIFAIILAWQSYRVNSIQNQYQHDLMSSVTQSILKEFNQFFEQRRLEIDLFQSKNQEQLNFLNNNHHSISEPDYMKIHTKFYLNILLIICLHSLTIKGLICSKKLQVNFLMIVK